MQKFLVEGAYETGRRHATIMAVIPGLMDLGLSDSDVFEHIRNGTPAEKTDSEIVGLIKWWRKHWQEKKPRWCDSET